MSPFQEDEIATSSRRVYLAKLHTWNSSHHFVDGPLDVKVCLVALGLLVMAFAFFGDPALSEPSMAATQDWEETDAHGAQGPFVAVDCSSDLPTGTVYVGTTLGGGLDGGVDAKAGEMHASHSELPPATLRRYEFFLSCHG